MAENWYFMSYNQGSHWFGFGNQLVFSKTSWLPAGNQLVFWKIKKYQKLVVSDLKQRK